MQYSIPVLELCHLYPDTDFVEAAEDNADDDDYDDDGSDVDRICAALRRLVGLCGDGEEHPVEEEVGEYLTFFDFFSVLF